VILKLEDKHFAFCDALPLEIFCDAYTLDQVRIRAVEGVDRALKIDCRSFAQRSISGRPTPSGRCCRGSCTGRSEGGTAGADEGTTPGAVVRFHPGGSSTRVTLGVRVSLPGFMPKDVAGLGGSGLGGWTKGADSGRWLCAPCNWCRGTALLRNGHRSGVAPAPVPRLAAATWCLKSGVCPERRRRAFGGGELLRTLPLPRFHAKQGVRSARREATIWRLAPALLRRRPHAPSRSPAARESAAG
jgi:hypothetical protein